MSVSVFCGTSAQCDEQQGIGSGRFVHAAEHRGVKMGRAHQPICGRQDHAPQDVLEFLASELDVDRLAARRGIHPTQLNSGRIQQRHGRRTRRHTACHVVPPSPRRTARFPWAAAALPPANRTSSTINVLYDVRGPVADEAMRMETNGTHILKFEHRQPGTFGFRRRTKSSTTSYQLAGQRRLLAVQGACSPRARPSCSTRSSKNIRNVTIDDMYTGNGVSELINLSMSALLDTGDEVLVPSRTTRCGPPA